MHRIEGKSIPKVARAHHYVPEFFLAGFTRSGTRDDKLSVVDLRRKKEWTSTPKNVGHRRDLYRVDVDGVETDFIENKVLSPIEDRAAKAIKEIHETERLPEAEDDRRALFSFLALLATRVPIAQFAVDKLADLMIRKHLNTSLESPEKWEGVLREMIEMGIDTVGMDYNRMKEESINARFSATRNFQMQMMLFGAAGIFPDLLKRTWSTAHSSSGSFICSDRPIALTFTKPMPPQTFPGFSLPDTQVVVPLSKHLVLYGTWRGHPEAGQINRKGVALTNSMTLENAERYVFASSNQFPWMDTKRTVRLGAKALPRKGEPVFICKDLLS